MTREPSLLEVKEDIDEMRAELRGLRSDLSVTYVRQDVYEAHRTARDTRVAELEGRLTWAWRAAVTGILLPIIATIVVFFLTGGPR